MAEGTQAHGQGHGQGLHLRRHSSTATKGSSYAFSLNLVRSLGLWYSTSIFPANVPRPQYLPLTSSSGSGSGSSQSAIDWPELLRKYVKHNPSPLAALAAACTRLEVATWQAVQEEHGQTHHDRYRRRRGGGRGSKGKSTAVDGADKPDEWSLYARENRAKIEGALQEVESAYAVIAKGDRSQSNVVSANTILALAYYTLGNYQQALTLLGTQAQPQISASKEANSLSSSDAATHDVDLQILSAVLRGLSYEHLGSPEQSVEAYRSLPCSPPPPIPEAQRYIEMGLFRLAALQSNSYSMDAHRMYLSSTSSFAGGSPHKRLRMYEEYLTTLLARISSSYSSSSPAPPNPINGDQFPSSSGDSLDTSDVASTFASYEALLRSHASLASFPRAGEATPNMDRFIDLMHGYWEYGLLSPEWVVDALYRALEKTYASLRLLRVLVWVRATMAFSASERPRAREWAEDAIRNLRLYISLFEKSKDTDQKAIERELRRFRKRTEGRERPEQYTYSDGEDEEEDNEEGAAHAVESDEQFCTVCCIGTRLLLAESRQDNRQEQEDARLDLVQEARETIEKAKAYLDKKNPMKKGDKITGADSNERDCGQDGIGDGDGDGEGEEEGEVRVELLKGDKSTVKAEVLLWLGVSKVESALADADPETARVQAKQALKHLTNAISIMPPAEKSGANTGVTTAPNRTDDSSSSSKEGVDNHYRASLRTRTLYSLAYSQLELRDLGGAVATAKKAVESLPPSPGPSFGGSADERALEASEMRVWHLFVLALSATKDWKKAKEVAELALYGNTLDDIASGEAGSSASVNSGQSPQPAQVAFSAIPASTEDSAGADDTPMERPRMHLVASSISASTLRAGAPYDPSSTGGPALTPRILDSDSSSFVNVLSPNDPSGSSQSSSMPHRRRRRPSQAAHFRPSRGVSRIVTQRLNSDWDDLEAEIELCITRNRCIEAIDGPEYALLDLQRNVFTRFSKRREELEEKNAAEGKTLSALSTPSRGTMNGLVSGYPYASKEMKERNPSLENTGGTESPNTGRARSIIGSISLRHRSNSIRRNNATQSQASDRLAVPANNGRPASIRSNLSANPSIETSTRPTSPTALSNGAQAVGKIQNHHPRAARLLSKLWLASAASFRRWGKLDECRGAINEAEDVAGNVDPDVWVQYAHYLWLTSKEPAISNEQGLMALQKAISISTDHVPIVLSLAKMHLDAGNWASSEGFLDVATQSNAWDSPEAWYLLAKVYENTRRGRRAKECLLYALGLEETRPIRELRMTLERFL